MWSLAMMMIALAGMWSALVASHSAAAVGSPPEVTVCELVAKPRAYVSRVIRVYGRVTTSGIGPVLLSDSSCNGDFVVIKIVTGSRLWRAIFRHGYLNTTDKYITATVSGRFKIVGGLPSGMVTVSKVTQLDVAY
jgi:hypothetical protein